LYALSGDTFGVPVVGGVVGVGVVGGVCAFFAASLASLCINKS
jgi:hypothetical protein